MIFNEKTGSYVEQPDEKIIGFDVLGNPIFFKTDEQLRAEQAKSAENKVPAGLASQRYAYCKICDRFNNLLKICKECYCFMPIKVRVTLASCPKEKW